MHRSQPHPFLCPATLRLRVAKKGSQELSHPPPVAPVCTLELPPRCNLSLACLPCAGEISAIFLCAKEGALPSSWGGMKTPGVCRGSPHPLCMAWHSFGDSVIGTVSKEGQNPTQVPARLDTWALWWECVAQGKPPGAKFVVIQPPSRPQALENTVMVNVRPCRAGLWHCFSPLPAFVGGNPLHICGYLSHLFSCVLLLATRGR